MGFQSANRRLYLSTQTDFDTPASNVNRGVPFQLAVDPNQTVNNVTERLDGSRASDSKRQATGRVTRIPISGQGEFESLAPLLAMNFGGGNSLNKEIVDRVTDPNAGAGTTANPTDPEQVAKYTSSVETKGTPEQQLFTGFYTSGREAGDITYRVSTLYADTLGLNSTVGGTTSVSSTLVGHYKETYTQNYSEPRVIEGLSPIDTTNWSFSVDGTSLTHVVTNVAITMPSGKLNQGYLDGGLDFNTIYHGRRKGNVVLRLRNGVEAEMIQGLLDDLTPVELIIQNTGANIRVSNPNVDRSLKITMYGQFTGQRSLLPDENGLIVRAFTFETLPNPATDKDMEFELVCANDRSPFAIT